METAAWARKEVSVTGSRDIKIGDTVLVPSRVLGEELLWFYDEALEVLVGERYVSLNLGGELEGARDEYTSKQFHGLEPCILSHID